MNVLELFSGTQSIGKKFRAKGHNVLSVELNPIFTTDEWGLEQWTMSVSDVDWKKVEEHFGGAVDVIWASPMCTTHSIAAISHHRTRGEDGLLYPKSDNAKAHDEVLKATLNLIDKLMPKYYFIENPRGGMRKAPMMQDINDLRHTLTYCQYGDTRMKPTDIWTNHPDPKFKPACKNGAPCHESAPRGSRTGTQGLKGNMERSVIPPALCEHIVEISEE